jgi:DNA-directed RNA polymerase subunit RPC12/RpoP
MTHRRCPGMDPAFFKPEDIREYACPGCGAEMEFWKDDVRLTCAKCGRVVLNPELGTTCLAWCAKASECVGQEVPKARGQRRSP